MSLNLNFCNSIAKLAETYLNLNKWGFQEDTRVDILNVSQYPLLVYKSPICKLKISFNEWTPPHQAEEYSIDVFYGRLSATNNKNIIGNGEDACYCWHSVARVLHFLDGSEVSYTAKNLLSHDRIKAYGQLLSSSSLIGKQPEWELRKHAYIWEEYAPRLFELFDVQNTDIWERYKEFLKQVYDIKGRRPNIVPPLDKVC
jgi:hypothetical protein